MKFCCEEELKQYMQKTGRRNVIVEVVTSSNSDIEVSELHVHLGDDRQLASFLKKRYRCVETDFGQVLLPPFALRMEDTVTFGLKKFLFFHGVKYQGIRI